MRRHSFSKVRLVVRDREIAEVRRLADSKLAELGLPGVHDEEAVELEIGWLKAKEAVKQANGFQFTLLGVGTAFLLYSLGAAISAGGDLDWGAFSAYILLTVGAAVLCFFMLTASDVSPDQDSVIADTVAVHIADKRPRPLETQSSTKSDVEDSERESSVDSVGRFFVVGVVKRSSGGRERS